MITYKTATTLEELQQILDLQRANLPSAISSEEKQKEGFVTVHHDFELLERMNDACPHTIAIDDGKVVGYALSMHPKFGDEIDVLKSMFKEIKRVISAQLNDQMKSEIPVTTATYIIMGQICIDKQYRKQGIFRKLYEFMLQSVQRDFTTIITEVDATNIRSLNAHYGIGFKKLSTYQADRRKWELIYLK